MIHIFKTKVTHVLCKKTLIYATLPILFFSITVQGASSVPYSDILKQSGGAESFSINIFCTEVINKKYLKAVSGSGVFISNPTENKSIVLTNAHVARHLLDTNKKCVGRTGNPASVTHKLKLRYIPSFWLQTNGSYIIGDPNKNSTGEFDFAVIETEKIQTTTSKKTSTNIYDVFKPQLKLQLQDYLDKTSSGLILSYPAQKTLSKNIYNPLYIKKDNIIVKEAFSSPTYQESDSLLDTYGSTNIDHGSSGGMVLLQNTSNNLIGLSSILIQPNSPQTVRVVTLKHIFSVIEKDLKSIQTTQSDIFAELLTNVQKQKTSDETFANIFKNNKLTTILEKQTKDTLLKLGIKVK